MLELNALRKEFARYMTEENARGSMDAALFHVLKLAYEEGMRDGYGNTRGDDGGF